MSDKRRQTFALPLPKTGNTVRPKRPTTATLTASSKTRVPQSVVKDPSSRSKISANTTVLGFGDLTIANQDVSTPEFEQEYRQIAYGKLLRSMLEDCVVEDKIQREETEMDVQMAQLALRFEKTTDLLEKTNRRLKDIRFTVEQRRLMDLKNNDTSKFYNLTNNTNASDILRDLTLKEKASLDRLETKNVDFGYHKESGHQQLLDAVNDAVTGLEEIKKHSKLDANKFKEFERAEASLNDLEKDKMDLQMLRKEFEKKFPKFSEQLLKETSEKITNMLKSDVEEEEDDEISS